MSKGSPAPRKETRPAPVDCARGSVTDCLKVAAKRAGLDRWLNINKEQ